MENRAHALAAGIFLLVATGLLVLMGLWLTQDSASHQRFELSSREAVTGLQPQAGVRFKGVTIGKVESIGFDPQTQGNVLIRISTEQNVPITKSTYGTLGFQGVTGLAFIQLDDGGESKDMLATTDAKPARIPMRASLLSKLTDQGGQILSQIEESSKRINQLLSAENQADLTQTIRDVGKVARGFGNAANSIDLFAQNADRILDAQFGPEKMNLPRLVAEMEQTMKSLQVTAKSVDGTATEFTATAKELGALARQVNQPDSPLNSALDKLGKGADAMVQAGQAVQASTLPRVNRAADDASRSARSLGRTAAGLNDNPQSLVWGLGSPPPGPGEAGFVAPSGSGTQGKP
jgi:phospholipid/cholesterol/gamma-HCH transport system substrate-binding protein